MRDYKVYPSKNTIVDKIALVTVATILVSSTIVLSINEINKYFGF